MFSMFISLIMSCLHHTNLSSLLHPLDPASKEPELEALAKQAEGANTDPEQGKPQCITP
jgi:hypothetical protein